MDLCCTRLYIYIYEFQRRTNTHRKMYKGHMQIHGNCTSEEFGIQQGVPYPVTH